MAAACSADEGSDDIGVDGSGAGNEVEDVGRNFGRLVRTANVDSGNAATMSAMSSADKFWKTVSGGAVDFAGCGSDVGRAAQIFEEGVPTGKHSLFPRGNDCIKVLHGKGKDQPVHNSLITCGSSGRLLFVIMEEIADYIRTGKLTETPRNGAAAHDEFRNNLMTAMLLKMKMTEHVDYAKDFGVIRDDKHAHHHQNIRTLQKLVKLSTTAPAGARVMFVVVLCSAVSQLIANYAQPIDKKSGWAVKQGTPNSICPVDPRRLSPSTKQGASLGRRADMHDFNTTHGVTYQRGDSAKNNPATSGGSRDADASALVPGCMPTAGTKKVQAANPERHYDKDGPQAKTVCPQAPVDLIDVTGCDSKSIGIPIAIGKGPHGHSGGEFGTPCYRSIARNIITSMTTGNYHHVQLSALPLFGDGLMAQLGNTTPNPNAKGFVSMDAGQLEEVLFATLGDSTDTGFVAIFA